MWQSRSVIGGWWHVLLSTLVCCGCLMLNWCHQWHKRVGGSWGQNSLSSEPHNQTKEYWDLRGTHHRLFLTNLQSYPAVDANDHPWKFEKCHHSLLNAQPWCWGGRWGSDYQCKHLEHVLPDLMATRAMRTWATIDNKRIEACQVFNFFTNSLEGYCRLHAIFLWTSFHFIELLWFVSMVCNFTHRVISSVWRPPNLSSVISFTLHLDISLLLPCILQSFCRG